MTSASLHDALQLPVGDRLRLRIQAAMSEDPAYAADELVELAEEVLLQIAADLKNTFGKRHKRESNCIN